MVSGSRSLLCILGVAAMLLAAPVCAQQAEKSMSAADASRLDQALKLEDQDRNAEAQPILRQLFLRYPQNLDVAEALGLCLAESGKLDAALPLLERVVRAAPHSAVAFANLGAAYLKRDQPVKAVAALEKARALDPQNVETASSLGSAYLANHQPKQAVEVLAQASALKPQDAAIRYRWATALSLIGDTTQARRVLSDLPAKDTSAPLQSLLGEVSEKEGQYKEAAEHLQAAARLDPSEANLYALGMEFLRHWSFEAAIKIFDFGVTRFPESHRMLLGQGIARYSINDLNLAAPIFAKLLESEPGNAFYADLLGKSCGLMPDASPGCERLTSFAERHPEDASAATYAAASMLHRADRPEDWGKAEELLNRAIAHDPAFAEAHFQKGLLDQYKQQWAPSVQELERTVALKPGMSKAHYRLALAYNHLGQVEKAKEEIRLQQKYSEQEKRDLDARFKEVTTFLVAIK